MSTVKYNKEEIKDNFTCDSSGPKDLRSKTKSIMRKNIQEVVLRRNEPLDELHNAVCYIYKDYGYLMDRIVDTNTFIFGIRKTSYKRFFIKYCTREPKYLHNRKVIHMYTYRPEHDKYPIPRNIR